MKHFLLTGIYCLICFAAFAEVDSTNYVVGNVLYEQGNYTEAINVYQHVIGEKGYSPEVNYNLGNCYYKTGDIGNSILNYERALRLDPGNGDIKYNLDLANLRIRDRISTVDELILSIWWRNILNLFTTHAWAILAVCFAWLSLTGFLFYRLSNRLSFRKTGFYSFLVFLIVCILTVVIAFSSNKWQLHHTYAIVMEPSSILKSEPNESSTNLSLIHEGLKVQVLDEQDGWTEIKMSDGNEGWLLSSTIEVI